MRDRTFDITDSSWLLWDDFYAAVARLKFTPVRTRSNLGFRRTFKPRIKPAFRHHIDGDDKTLKISNKPRN